MDKGAWWAQIHEAAKSWTQLSNWLAAAAFIYLAALGLSCGMRDLVPWPGIGLEPLALGVWSLSHWTTREVPPKDILINPHSHPPHILWSLLSIMELTPWCMSILSAVSAFMCPCLKNMPLRQVSDTFVLGIMVNYWVKPFSHGRFRKSPVMRLLTPPTCCSSETTGVLPPLTP